MFVYTVGCTIAKKLIIIKPTKKVIIQQFILIIVVLSDLSTNFTKLGDIGFKKIQLKIFNSFQNILEDLANIFIHLSSYLKFFKRIQIYFLDFNFSEIH